jgi:hypothetical protein
MRERNIILPDPELNSDWDVLRDAPDHAESVQALRRANDRERKKAARLNATPEQRAREREREHRRPPRQLTPAQRERRRELSRYRQLTAEQRERRRRLSRNRILSPQQREKRRELSRNRLAPFWAVDGEGAGTDDKGRQPYVLMAASGPGADEPRMVHRDGAGLSVRDCLEFLLSLPRGLILVGFSFGYDANQMIRGTKIETQKRIIHPPHGEYGGALSTFWGEYAITWVPGQFFRVSHLDRSTGKAVVVASSDPHRL